MSPQPSRSAGRPSGEGRSRPSLRAEQRRAVMRRRLAVASIIVIAGVVAAIAAGAGGSHGRSTNGAATSSLARTSSPGISAASAPSASGGVSGPPGTTPVPILMYHVIAAPPAGAPFPGLYVSPSEFVAQMQALKDAGWHAVTLDQLASYWQHGTPLGTGRPVVLTFDNGYHSQYSQALPVLQRLGWVADENIQLTGLPPSQGGLGDGEVRALLAAGWELDTQGFSHADLIALDSEQLHYQVAVARGVLQRRYHVAVNWFCYPSGHYDATVLAAVKAAGYVGSTTVVPGWAHPSDDPYRLHRLRVLGGTSGQALLDLIAGSREDPPAPASYGGG